MGKFEHDTVVPIRHSSLKKKQQVAGMFNDIAHRYDFLNRFLSAGIDMRWRKRRSAIEGYQSQNLLDVATGTADMAIMASGSLLMYR